MSRIATRRVTLDNRDGSGSGDADAPDARRADGPDGPDGPESDRPDVPDDGGLLTARTAAGTCYLHPGYHSRTTSVPRELLAGVDGLVLEAAGHRYERLDLDALRTHGQYEELLAADLDGERVPVYAVDVPPVGGIDGLHEGWLDEARELLVVAGTAALVGLVGVALGAWPGALLCLPLAVVLAVGYLPSRLVSRKGLAGQTLRRLFAYGQLLNAYSLAAARSAAVAETLDARLLPYLRQELGRRPALFLDYGVAHLDVYVYLRHPRLRRAVVRLYRWHDAGNRDWRYLDRVCAFEFDGLTEWNRVETDDGIPYKQVVLTFESDGEGR